jgi:hypothetical protein
MQRFFGAVSLTVLLCGFSAIAQVQPRNPDPVAAALLDLQQTATTSHAHASISRAELASLLVKSFRLDRLPPTQSSVTTVHDVPPTHWAYEDIQVVLRTGIMTGYRQGRFFPEQRVTRAEAFSILAQTHGVYQFSDETVDTILAKYADAHQIPPWARKSMATVVYEGLVNTGVDRQLRPLQPMTRSDMAYALKVYLSHRKTLESPLRWTDPS